MANAWCFDPATNTIGDLESVRQEYVNKLQEVHEQINAEEWAEIVEPMKLGDNDLGGLVKRPSWNTLYNWSELVTPFGETRKKLPDFAAQQKALVAVAGAANALVDTTSRFARSHPPAQELFNEIQELQPKEYFAGGYKEQTEDDFVTSIDKFRSLEMNQAGESQVVDEDVGAALTDFKNKLAAFRREIFDNIYVAKALCSTTDFKDEYLKALMMLALPEIKKKAKEEGIDPILPESLGDFFTGFGVPGAAYRAISTLFGTEQIEDIRKRIQAAIEAVIEEEFKEAFADNIAYNQQCTLLSFMDDIIYAKQLRDETINPPELPYGRGMVSNLPLRVVGEPFGFVSRLVVDPTQKELFDLRPEVISSLIPHIRFFKVEANDKGEDEETEIEFSSNAKDDVYSDIAKKTLRKQRGYGVGMKSFNFSYDGTDPFSAKKMIAAKLSIYASTFDELLRERGKGKKYKYADLALKTGGVGGKKDKNLSELERENLNKLNFRLKVTVGWNVPNNSVFKNLSQDIKDAIYNSYITLYLTPTIHNFDFDETGAVTFDIEYLAYIEDAFSQSSYNIFSKLTKEKESRQVVLNYFEEMNCDTAGDEFKEFRKKDEELVARINTDAFSHIIGGLEDKGRMYYLNFGKADFLKLQNNPADESVKFPKPTGAAGARVSDNFQTAAISNAVANLDDIDRNEALLSIVAVSQESTSIPYFYLGDLVSVIMENMEIDLAVSTESLEKSNYYEALSEFQEGSAISKFDTGKIKKQFDSKKIKLKNDLEQFRKMRVILGPMEMFVPLKSSTTEGGGGSILCSIADIPISLPYFFEFMSDRVLSKEIISYPFSKFLKDVINDLIKNFLNSGGCTRVDNSQKIALNSTTVCAYNQNGYGSTKTNGTSLDDITYSIMQKKDKRSSGLPVLTLSGERNTPKETLSIDRMMSYFVFSVGRKSPVSDYTGNKEADAKNGIFHYMIGQDSGIVKNITLEKTSTPGHKEVRFEQEGYNGLEQLREVYNARIDTFLNVQSFPGVYVYVEPKGFAPNTSEDLTRFGIGGYCMVVKTEHTIAPGVADSTLHTVWVASKGSDNKTTASSPGENTPPAKRKVEGKEKIRKCLVGPHNIGMIVTRRGRYSSLTDKEAGKLGSEVVSSGAYEV